MQRLGTQEAVSAEKRACRNAFRLQALPPGGRGARVQLLRSREEMKKKSTQAKKKKRKQRRAPSGCPPWPQGDDSTSGW